jgi:molecular chaperone HscB
VLQPGSRFAFHELQIPPTVRAPPDHFALFGFEPRFELDDDALDAAYKRVQEKVHPDRFAAATAAERRVAVQWAARANEALRTLRSPTRRAAYLCELNGVPIEAESNTAMPRTFLMQQLEWREALDEARSAETPAPLAALARQIDAARHSLHADLADALDIRRDFARAAALVRQLMFIDKLHDEIAASAAVDAWAPAAPRAA